MSNFFVFVSHHEIIFFSSFCTYKLWWRKSIYFHFNAHPFLPSSSSSSNRSRSHFNLHHSTRSAHTHVLREQLFHISHDELKSVIHLWRWWWFNLPTHESVVNLIFEKSFICHVQWSLRGGGEKSSFVIKKSSSLSGYLTVATTFKICLELMLKVVDTSFMYTHLRKWNYY